MLEYWEAIRERSDKIDIFELLAERLGYPLNIGFEEWVAANGYRYLNKETCEALYRQEQEYIRTLKEQAPALKEIADKRISEFREALHTYIAIH